LRYYKKALVIFFSFILIFSLFASIPNYTYAQQPGGSLLLWDPNQFSTFQQEFGPAQTIVIGFGKHSFDFLCTESKNPRLGTSSLDAITDKIYAASDIYIVPLDYSKNQRGPPILNDVSGSENTIVTVLDTTFEDFAIGTTLPNTVGNGIYNIVYDTCSI
jgi:hypothetical protein